VIGESGHSGQELSILPRNLSRPVGVIAVAAVASAVVAFIVLEVSPTGMSSLANAVSQYALTRYIWGFRWFEVSLTIAGVALASVFATSFRQSHIGEVIALALFAFGRSFVGWVNMDAPGAAATLRGDIHWGLGIVSFVSMIVAMFLAARTLRAAEGHESLRTFSLILAWLTLACIALFFASTRVLALSAFLGLIERGFYVATMVWVATISVQALRGRFDQPKLSCPNLGPTRQSGATHSEMESA
jgi:hypothetical protein